MLNNGLSDKLKQSFPNIKSIDRPFYKFNGIPSPYWVSGFVSGDGSFNIFLEEKKLISSDKLPCRRKIVLSFGICLKDLDEEVIKGLVTYFESLVPPSQKGGAGGEKVYFTGKKQVSKHFHKYKTSVSLYFRRIAEILYIIIPFFEKYPVLGKKNLDFLDFKEVSIIMKNKEHLTLSGYNKIKNINSTMNLRRPW